MNACAVRVRVRGVVQGVGFRWFVQRHARALHVRGHARNLADGSVEVVAIGDAGGIEALLRQLRTGPPAARVNAVDCQTLEPAPHYGDFEIRA